jgi:hypothetical protein
MLHEVATGTRPSMSLSQLALLALAQHAPDENAPELSILEPHRARFSAAALSQALTRALTAPTSADDRLFELGRALSLSPLELLTVALSSSVESSFAIARAVAYLQAPLAGSRPMIGLLQRVFAFASEDDALDVLLTGSALESGLLSMQESTCALVERCLHVPAHVALALRGRVVAPPGSAFASGRDVPLATSVLESAARLARTLRERSGENLVIRSGDLREARSLAAAVAAELGLRPLLLPGELAEGLTPWLWLTHALPVFVRSLAPSERFRIPTLPGYSGASLLITGPDGAVEGERGTVLEYRVPVPQREERVALWGHSLGVGAEALAVELGHDHRHPAGRIAELGQLARQHAALAGRGAPVSADVHRAALDSDHVGLAALAEALPLQVPTSALVLQEAVRADLTLLLERCRRREQLYERVGEASQLRYSPGVRALFVGPSGTGKTLAASWLATQLGLPLYRVDLASILSKYIGETEKNLAHLLACAEHAEVVLLVDEADSLFGKRTEVKQSNDRFANSQTNYLLQRIESYRGVILLTSNSQQRFDGAFARRLDYIVEFPLPQADERRELWLRHLGAQHGLSAAELAQLAAWADLPGGHIRNVVLSASALTGNDETVGWNELTRALELELRKLGKQLPAPFTRKRA